MLWIVLGVYLDLDQTAHATYLVKIAVRTHGVNLV